MILGLYLAMKSHKYISIFKTMYFGMCLPEGNCAQYWQRSEKGSQSPGKKIQMAVSHHMGAEEQTHVLCKILGIHSPN